MRELSINNDVFEENEENTVENEPPNENNKEVNLFIRLFLLTCLWEFPNVDGVRNG